jgi:hypothetical protein
MKKIIKIIKHTILIMSCFLLLSCAQSQPHIEDCIEGQKYGFWSGLWHGIISPITFIISLFNDNIDVYAINNNKNWYCFGFLLGCGTLSNFLTLLFQKN